MFFNLPREIQAHIYDFTGEKEKNMKIFSQNVLPGLLIEVILKELQKFNYIHPEGYNFKFEHSNDPNRKNFLKMICINPDIQESKREIQYIIINIENYHKDFAPILSWYDFEWFSLNDFTDFILDHWIYGIPFPLAEEYNRNTQLINYLDPEELDLILDQVLNLNNNFIHPYLHI
jgi:hypothetical protein